MVGENDLEFETNQTREKERLVSTLSLLFYFISLILHIDQFNMSVLFYVSVWPTLFTSSWFG